MKIIKMIDYLSNNTIMKKDFLIVDNFLRTELIKMNDVFLFKEVKQTLEDLKIACYSVYK